MSRILNVRGHLHHELGGVMEATFLSKTQGEMYEVGEMLNKGLHAGNWNDNLGMAL